LATDRQTDKQTNRQTNKTDKQLDSSDALSRSRCRERRLNKRCLTKQFTDFQKDDYSLSFGPNAVSNKKTPVMIPFFDRPVVQSPIRMDGKLYDTLQADTTFTTKIVRLY